MNSKMKKSFNCCPNVTILGFVAMNQTFDIQVVHGAERGEATTLLLSPTRPVFPSSAGADPTQNGSQFTCFRTSPLRAVCQLFGLSPSHTDTTCTTKPRTYSTALSEWEVILCKSTSLDLVWAQVLSDPFLPRLILRFIFCRSVLSIFCSPGDNEACLPNCLPYHPDLVSSSSEAALSSVFRLAHTLGVTDCFQSKLTSDSFAIKNQILSYLAGKNLWRQEQRIELINSEEEGVGFAVSTLEQRMGWDGILEKLGFRVYYEEEYAEGSALLFQTYPSILGVVGDGDVTPNIEVEVEFDVKCEQESQDH
ncbi:hypothetical protein NE237_029251 [Protea cynaroides]|uniref:Uncharacterized protein n=1 Tax=Protea cynaroides TaxID=273540 RepID=A0A9Q0GVG3_9MAGN|nr:hypothetical protein NE237_029251 [Protea cynaroides]